MIKILLNLSFIYILTSTNAFATGIQDAISLSLNQNPTKAERLKIANSLNSECGELLKAVPVLSPKEEKWLNNELNSGRVESLMRKPEFSMHLLRNFFSTCIEGAEIIIHSKNRHKETLGWSVLLVTLIEQDITYHMKQSGILFTEHQITAVPASLRLIAAPVLKNILIPMLINNTKIYNETLGLVN